MSSLPTKNVLAFSVALLLTLPSPTRAADSNRLPVHSDNAVGPGAYFHHKLGLDGSVTPKNVIRTFNAADGFPEAIVTDFAQSSDGTIWMATEHGLYAFDGCRIRHLNTGYQTVGTAVEFIRTQAGQEEIWFGTRLGLTVVSLTGFTIQRIREFDGEPIHCIGKTRAGDPLVGTQNGLYFKHNSKFQPAEHSGDQPAVLSIEAKGSGKGAWIGTRTGLYVYDHGKLQQFEQDDLKDDQVNALHVDSNGALWIGTANAILRRNDDGLVLVCSVEDKRLAEHKSNPCTERPFVRNFVESRQGQLWASTDVATIRIAADQVAHPNPIADCYLSLPVASQLIDRDGHRWISLEKSHIKCIYSDIRHYTHERTRFVLRQPDSQTVWFTTAPENKRWKLARLQDGTIKARRIPFEPTCVAWFEDRLLVGTNKGLFEFDTEISMSRHLPGKLAPTRVYCMAVDDQGSLWVSCSNGIYQIRKNRVAGFEPAGSDPVVSILPNGLSKRGVIQLRATKRLIQRFEGDRVVETFDFSRGLAARSIHALALGKDGRLWIGSGHGLFVGNGLEHIKKVSPEKRLIGSFLRHGNTGELWAGSSFGLCRVDTSRDLMQAILPDDGFGPGNILHCSPDGENTWIAGERGLFLYQNKTAPPAVVIDGITTDRELATTRTVNSTTDEVLLSFRYHAISTGMRNGSMLYRYRLHGLDNEWKETRLTEVRFQNLSAGDYEFEVQAVDRNLLFSEPARVPVSVSVPFLRYATYVMLALIGISLFAGGLFVIRVQRQRNQALSERVRETVREQLQLEEELMHSQRLESLGTLAAGMAHDFNNTLQVIHANAEIALMERDLTSIQKSVQRVQTAANQATELTRSMLLFAGKGGGSVSTVDLAQLMSECVNIMEHTTSRSINLKFTIANRTNWFCNADEGKLKQVFVNLLVNARDAMPDGGDLTVNLLESNLGDNRLVVEISDRGSGICPEQIDRIFEPFFTTKPRGEGTGLGLSIVHGIIQSHGGTITCDSRVGYGTTFEIRLPPADEPELPMLGQQQQPAGRSRPQSSAASVLVADDQRGVLRVITKTLQSFGCQVVQAANGIEALGIGLNSDFDAIILDVDMPGLNGIEVAVQLRDKGRTTPVVLITGGVSKFDVLPTDVHLIRKPFSIDELRNAVFRTCEPTT